ncbi:hypothetical protein [Pelomonas sp. SE-A7]|uniref:hypothetical protein n=1 Tax=Pelomonas sp. SE-A7 TaxID=3054953 RepID=UPI00259D1874|nr:hypothetical protein [Pelomonas sp. SE-A7]MDM4768021.1 hypothetical protein [Pelomonas sp. SE-A7]
MRRAVLRLVLVTGLLAGPAAVLCGTGIFVNGAELKPETVQALQQVYPTTVAPGRYWYDALSGAWGVEGQPIAGQLMPGLNLGGTLKAEASRGDSGVFINGRQIQRGEKAYLEMLCQTPVRPARYWIMANGIGGYEGLPASFNLAQCPGLAQGGGGGRSSSRTWCEGSHCTTTSVLGYISTSR